MFLQAWDSHSMIACAYTYVQYMLMQRSDDVSICVPGSVSTLSHWVIWDEFCIARVRETTKPGFIW